MIVINCYPITMLCYRIIPFMLKRSEQNRRRSGIINLASFLGEYPAGFVQLYSATKAFDDYLSRSLHFEYSDKIDILSLRPNHVSTNLTNNSKVLYSITPD